MNTPESKIYAPASAKQITFQSGRSILKLGINVEKFKAFLDQHKNAKGYVNLGISSRKETSAYGETHTVWLDTFQPGERSASAPAPKPAPARQQPPPANDDVPF